MAATYDGQRTGGDQFHPTTPVRPQTGGTAPSAGTHGLASAIIADPSHARFCHAVAAVALRVAIEMATTNSDAAGGTAA